MVNQGNETPAYATAFAALTLSVPEGRLSIFNRTGPPAAVGRTSDLIRYDAAARCALFRAVTYAAIRT